MPYTRDEANSLLPELREKLAALQAAFALANRHQEEVESLQGGNGGGPQVGDFLKASRLISETLEWISDKGIILRDASQGLCDFPSFREGKEIFLCWKLGEDSVDHWHDLETGFSAREPLD